MFSGLMSRCTTPFFSADAEPVRGLADDGGGDLGGHGLAAAGGCSTNWRFGPSMYSITRYWVSSSMP